MTAGSTDTTGRHIRDRLQTGTATVQIILIKGDDIGEASQRLLNFVNCIACTAGNGTPLRLDLPRSWGVQC